uniref:GPN-loop GTPase 1 n=1 Tax=Hirondellea gigas TaxID=1518452 RepID=A0A2P2I778_9CRUS
MSSSDPTSQTKSLTDAETTSTAANEATTSECSSSYNIKLHLMDSSACATSGVQADVASATLSSASTTAPGAMAMEVGVSDTAAESSATLPGTGATSVSADATSTGPSATSAGPSASPVGSSETSTGSSAPPNGATSIARKKPVCVLVLGMAGAGKTNVVRRLSTHLACTLKNSKGFHTINLDPAVKNLPYAPYIDIRDTVNYKEVMNQYGLGPNGGIVTSLNLFSTMFEDVLKLIAKREDDLEYVLFDTPGQIEVFNWSASGPIIAGALASVYPTIIVYVVDTVRSNNTQTFMANMVYACSILYKYKLPFVMVFNKIDITDCKFAFDWMRDFVSFQDVLAEESTFSANLTRTLSLALEEFYCNIKACGVSSVTGEGMAELVEQMEAAAIEFEEYREDYEQLKAEKLRQKEQGANTKSSKNDPEADSLKKVRKIIKDETEVLIGLAESDSESDEERIDEDDTEEVKELESFQSFIKQQKQLHQTQQKQEEQNPPPPQ